MAVKQMFSYDEITETTGHFIKDNLNDASSITGLVQAWGAFALWLDIVDDTNHGDDEQWLKKILDSHVDLERPR